MKKSVIKEIKQIIKKQNLNCPVEEFKDKANWYNISYQYLSEAFIREFKDEVDWDCISRSQYISEAFIREFKDEVTWGSIACYQPLSENFIGEFKEKLHWPYISSYQHLSEDFIREFKDRVNWDCISHRQTLSEDFIREFQDKVSWYHISLYQILSEAFIREFKDNVAWDCISLFQPLSEDFIREFRDEVEWYNISFSQVLSEDFIKEFKDKIDIKLYRSVNEAKSLEQKTKEIKEYAETYNLKFDGKYLYAFRNHDKWGHGAYSKTITYQKGKYYKDWHCDMRKDINNSFGLGIWPKGNTPVKVKVSDWGVEVNRIDEMMVRINNDGKARVCGFEVI